MQVIHDQASNELLSMLQRGGVAVLRTDTLYGIVAQADNRSSVERIYTMKGRDEGKSPIVLIASTEQLYDGLSDDSRQFLDSVWPGKVSVILPSENAPEWICRGNQSVAYRLPADEVLRSLVEKTGPLIAPSANPQDRPPAISIDQAIEYFGDQVDVYVDGGRIEDTLPSQLIRLNGDGTTERLR